MYAGFLSEAAAEHPGLGRGAALARAASEAWSGLAATLLEASEAADPSPPLWARIGDRAGAVLEAEERLWAELDRGAAQAELSPGTSSRAK
jgi:hypothetical protein